MNRLTVLTNETGSALVGAVFVVAITLALGMAMMGWVTNESQSISHTRGSSQSLSVAESGAEWAVWSLRTPVTEGGMGNTWETANYDTTIAAAEGADETYELNINDPDGSQAGVATLVIQKADATSTAEKRITPIGQACLTDDCSVLGPEKIVQMLVEINTEPGDFYNYALYYSSTAANATLHLEEVWLSGGIYVGHQSNLIIKDYVSFNGDVYSHPSVQLTSCNGDSKTFTNGFKIYTFGVVQNKASCLNDQSAAQENWNGGDHDETFPEVESADWNDRDYYKAEADYFFPSDAQTNPSADQDVIFCADSDGHIHYETNFDETCTAGDPELQDGGVPIDRGMIFVAGKLAIHGTFLGQYAFVAAGRERGSSAFNPNDSDLWIGNMKDDGVPNGTDDLRSMETPYGVTEEADGLEPGDCQAGIDPVADGTDSIALVGSNVGIDSDDNPCHVRSIIWAKDNLTVDFTGQSAQMPDVLELHATILEVGKILKIQGSDRNLMMYFDWGLIQHLPPGVTTSTLGIGVTRKSYQEIFRR